MTATGIVPPTSHTWLAAYLLQELFSPHSPFRPYLDLLPASYPDLPLLFDDRDLSLLRGSFTQERIRERRETIAKEYDYLLRAVPALRVFRYEQFVWARVTVITRIFGLTIEGRKTQALVPIADLFNHKHPRETNWGYEDDKAGFVLTAQRTFAPGDEVHESYGHKCNSRFFLNYGFVLPDNEHNEAEITVEGPEGRRAFLVSARENAPRTREMFSFLRRVCAGGEGGDAQAPISARNEEAALRLLAAACERALAEFDTTIAEDDALLSDPATQGNARTCILMRRGEKRVLGFFLDLARSRLSGSQTSP